MEQSVQQKFCDCARRLYGKSVVTVTRSQIDKIHDTFGISVAWLQKEPGWKKSRGVYNVLLGPISKLSPVIKIEKETEMTTPILFTKTEPNSEAKHFIPKKLPEFYPFGCYEDVMAVAKTNIFYPMYITGPTRSGKTRAVLQVFAELEKPLVRLNITTETAEADLLGSFKLIEGNTVWEDGPIPYAMENGITVILDEFDLGGTKMLALQPVFEGEGIYLKKARRYVYPKPGFNLIATANTRGQGNEIGKYVGANVQNESSLERFAVTLDHGYPDKKTEEQILNGYFKSHNIDAPDFLDALVRWAETARATQSAGGVEEIITTGRLIHVINTYAIFEHNRIKAIRMAIARFDATHRAAFLQMYQKIDPNAKDASDDLISNVNGKKLLPHQVSATRKPFTPKQNRP